MDFIQDIEMKDYPGVIATLRFDLCTLSQNLDLIAVCPGLYQKHGGRDQAKIAMSTLDLPPKRRLRTLCKEVGRYKRGLLRDRQRYRREVSISG